MLHHELILLWNYWLGSLVRVISEHIQLYFKHILWTIFGSYLLIWWIYLLFEYIGLESKTVIFLLHFLQLKKFKLKIQIQVSNILFSLLKIICQVFWIFSVLLKWPVTMVDSSRSHEVYIVTKNMQHMISFYHFLKTLILETIK